MPAVIRLPIGIDHFSLLHQHDAVLHVLGELPVIIGQHPLLQFGLPHGCDIDQYPSITEALPGASRDHILSTWTYRHCDASAVIHNCSVFSSPELLTNSCRSARPK